MRRIVAAFLLVICSSVLRTRLNAVEPYSFYLVSKGRTYYVSPKGSNANSGLDPARAWQNSAKVNGYKFNRGDRVLFEGGQTFAGDIILTTSVTPGPFTMALTAGEKRPSNPVRRVASRLRTYRASQSAISTVLGAAIRRTAPTASLFAIRDRQRLLVHQFPGSP